MKPATPHTPLPWQSSHDWIYSKAESEIRSTVANAPLSTDAAYIVHAANAYPRLVAELKRLCIEIPKQLGSDKPMPNTLLRELGETDERR